MDVLPAAYIRGAWQMGDETVTVTDSADGTTVGEVSLGSTEQAAAAVLAAHMAFPQWSATPLAERKAILRRLMTGLHGRSQRIAASATAEVGSVSEFSLRVQAGLPVRALEGTIDAMDEIADVEHIGTSRVLGLPIGVVAAIAPWNYPLYQIMGKLAPALAAGCTVVVKPPQQAPLTAYDLVAELENAGVPAGVVNVVQGRGPVVGETFAEHPLVDMVSFTGSTAAGSRIAEVAARSVKKVALELGGTTTEEAAVDPTRPEPDQLEQGRGAEGDRLAAARPSADPEGPEPDLLEQAQEVAPTEVVEPAAPVDPEVSPADSWEQAQDAALDDEDEHR